MASPANFAVSTASDILSELLGAVDEQIIRAYRAKHIAPAIWRAAPEHFSVENARNWVQLQPFLDFVAQISQQPVPRTPKHSRPLPDSSSPGFIMAEDALEHLDPDYNSEHPSKRRHIQQNSSSSPPSSPTPQFRQPPAAEPPAVASVTPASAETVKPVKNHRSGKKITQTEKHIAANRVQISRKQWVDGIFHVTALQESWPVPNDGKMYAYIVDLTGSSLVFKDSKGEASQWLTSSRMRCVSSIFLFRKFCNILFAIYSGALMAGKVVRAVTRADRQLSTFWVMWNVNGPPTGAGVHFYAPFEIRSSGKDISDGNMISNLSGSFSIMTWKITLLSTIHRLDMLSGELYPQF
ncbi:hypothetical protein M422DRAFT_39030 [Sphaerobolus stellatus SS14]|uniref:Uncharacterized protein n=1 Tax=Sphaerobolus stellatus (strain SS14) TaxID=990650 RepID=A0A0C9T714_SPHS4|nr:hypothetical protein M422DRAFT_39030 [Sphaerobolus stellatus SS14]